MNNARCLAILLGASILLRGSVEAEARGLEETSVKMATKADSPDALMKRFVRALVESDRAAFLSCLSRETQLRWRNFQAVGGEPTLIGYEEIAKDFREKKGYYFVFLARESAGGEESAYDCFADNATQSDGKMWRKHGAETFTPPGSDGTFSKNGDYVRWKRVNGRWIIVEISYNTS